MKHSFHCRDISRPLSKPGIEIEVANSEIKRPCRLDEKCLVCGDELNQDANQHILRCSEDACGYGAHESCMAVLAKVNGSSLLSDSFCCNNVNFYIKPSEIRKLVNCSEIQFTQLKKAVIRRGVVDYKKYTPKRKRYLNPDIECDKCGKIIGINEEDHVLTHCSASSVGTPVPTRDFEYSFSKLKRLRRIALYDYPP